MSDIYENAVRNSSGQVFVLKGQATVNLYAQYSFTNSGMLKGTSLIVGARNIFDKDPPLSSTGYMSWVFNPQARYWYTGVKKVF